MLRRGGRPADDGALAARILTYLADDPERLGDFLALTGLTPASLRAAAGGPGFDRGILSYLAGREDLLVDFAHQDGIDPGTLSQVVQAAVGGEWDG